MNNANFIRLKGLIEELSSVVENQQKQLNLQNDLLNIQKFKFEQLEKKVSVLEESLNIKSQFNLDDKRFISR